MGAQLNIKDETIAEEWRSWARQDGRSITATMRDVMERERDRRDADRTDRLARMIAFTKELQAAVPLASRGLTSKEMMDSIYDDNDPDGFAR
jgi:hypothetical protein